MGPQAWAAFARALGVAMVRWGLDPKDGGVGLVFSQIEAAIARNDYDVARAQLRYLKKYHQERYCQFMKEYGDMFEAE